jgi:hypothetical protein
MRCLDSRQHRWRIAARRPSDIQQRCRASSCENQEVTRRLCATNRARLCPISAWRFCVLPNLPPQTIAKGVTRRSSTTFCGGMVAQEEIPEAAERSASRM